MHSHQTYSRIPIDEGPIKLDWVLLASAQLKGQNCTLNQKYFLPNGTLLHSHKYESKFGNILLRKFDDAGF